MFTFGKGKSYVMTDTTAEPQVSAPDPESEVAGSEGAEHASTLTAEETAAAEKAAKEKAELDAALAEVRAYADSMTEQDEAEPEATLEELLARVGGNMVYGAIQNASNGTARSAQQQDYRMGMSNLGHCRQYAALMTKQVAFSDVTDKTAAFIGTVLGKAIEDQLKIEHPDWIFQSEGVFSLPSGGQVPGHPDIVIPGDTGASIEEFLTSVEAATDAEGQMDMSKVQYPQGVWDLKSKDQLDSVRKYGQTQQQRFQLHGYVSAMIDKGVLDPDAPIWLMDVYFDRSGSVHEAYAVGHWYDPNVVQEIDDWVNDVKYAVIHDEDAARDMPRDWCWSWCEYATVCRGNDTDVEGLVDDPEFLAAVAMNREASALEREAKRLKASAQKVLEGRSGSTGEYTVRWIEIDGGTVAYERKPYKKLDIRPIGKPKAPAKPRRKKAES